MIKKKYNINNIVESIFGELIDFVKSMTWRKVLLYFLAMILLGTSVTLIQKTNLGMSSWDALNRNFYENTPLEYRVINPIVALVLMAFAYLVSWKKPSIMFLFPLLISAIIGAVIDVELLFMPDVSNISIIYNFIYLIIATFLIAIGLNLMIHCNFPLPALDRFCHAIATRFKLTFGQGKYIGEILALIATIIIGLYFGTQNHWFYLGFTTIFFIVFLGFVVDLVRNPLYRLLGIQTVEIYADDMLPQDINKENFVQATRALIIKGDSILLLHYKLEDFYLIPGGTREGKESLTHCLKREILEETGLKIKVNEQRLIIREYFPDSTYENHYFLAKMKSEKIYKEKINLTPEEEESQIEMVWLKIDEAVNILDNHDSLSSKGMHLMNREFIAIISAL